MSPREQEIRAIGEDARKLRVALERESRVRVCIPDFVVRVPGPGGVEFRQARLTAEVGVRVEHLRVELDGQDAPADSYRRTVAECWAVKAALRR